MRLILVFLLWCLLLTVCWPLALIALIALPVVWLLSIPFRVLLWGVEAILAFVKAAFFLPARLLGHRARS